MRRFLLLLVLLVLVTAAVLFFWQRARVQADRGPAVALCPGPDLYGYTCESGQVFAYIDATNNTGLMALDGLVTLDLPFPFTFYGTTYDQVQAISNGNLQFNNGNVDFQNRCLDAGPAPNMGDMIAPYWTDLDLRFAGALETAVIGEPPERIFVVEWDSVPPFDADPDDTVTFEVQLFEGSNDIVFFYGDVTSLSGSRGERATVGVQSAAQGLALQASCNSPAVGDGSRLRIAHPERPNPDIGLTAVTIPAAPQSTQPALAPRAPLAIVMAQLQTGGRESLPQQRARWQQQSPPRTLDWRWAKLLDNGREQLVLTWSSSGHPQRSEIAVLELDADRSATLVYDAFPAVADDPLDALALEAVADLTADGLDDVVLHDPAGEQVFVLTAQSGALQRLALPGRCTGGLGVLDADGDGRPEIVRDGCERPGRVLFAWDGAGFGPRP